MTSSRSLAAPSQQAINGALDIYVDGGRHGNIQHMLFGLEVLRDGTEAQIRSAILFVQSTHQLADGVIEHMLKTYGDDPAGSAPPVQPPTSAERSWENEGGAQSLRPVAPAPPPP
jgi:hypothetical protein